MKIQDFFNKKKKWINHANHVTAENWPVYRRRPHMATVGMVRVLLQTSTCVSVSKATWCCYLMAV